MSEVDDHVEQRRAKLDRLRASGVDPYPVGIVVDRAVADVVDGYADELSQGEGSGDLVSIAGRLVLRRGHGNLVFGVVREGDDEVQFMARRDRLGDAGMTVVDELDLGDWVLVSGEVARSRRGELSVDADAVQLIGKCLQQWPDKWAGLRDTETRYRQRWVDLAVNAETRRVFALRSRVLNALRAELLDRDYVEVETPMLHPLPGGAAAKPFVTHHNALDVDLYLRIAPELYLKRLVAGGMTRVFEINRSFRNEGIDTTHTPEFTMLESYEAYADYHAVAALTQALIQRAAREGAETLSLTYDGRPLELGGDWPRIPLLDLVRTATGVADLGYDTPIEELRALCVQHGAPAEPGWGAGKLILEMYELLVEHTLWEPTFVIDYPVEVSPLARRHRDNPEVTERFELIVAGRELANAFSELTDPDDQRARFEAQASARAAGDDEAMVVDVDYLRAMEFGMPPIGGLGLGIDRLVMLIADVAAIRDVILFPTLRPHGANDPVTE